MANTSPLKEETIGNYRRILLNNGNYIWVTKDGRPITSEVQVGNLILKRDGTKVHTTARLANKQAARNNAAKQATKNINLPTNWPLSMTWKWMPLAEVTLPEVVLDVLQLPLTPKLTTELTPKLPPKRRVSSRINRPDYAKNFSNLNLSQNEIDYILDKGFDPYSAEGVQNFILSENDLIDLGSRKGIGTADGLWGLKSLDAFKALRDKGIFKSQVEEPVEELVVDAPDPFGYKTSNTYEDDDFTSKLKRMGIRSNADLMHFMYESGKEGWQGDEWTTQFRNDVDRLLGGDYSDANIRKVFKTKNGWNNGFIGRGDFGDFQNVLQTNAGVWNGIYELKQNNAKMDAVRLQLANKLAQSYADKLTPLLFKPTFNFNLKQGNIGAGSLKNPFGFQE